MPEMAISNLAPGLLARERIMFWALHDLHRLAHVEHEHLAGFAPMPPACTTNETAPGMVMEVASSQGR